MRFFLKYSALSARRLYTIFYMSSTSMGREAESFVAQQLEKKGYKLVAQNWRTRWCEIDLIMSKDGTVYFIEVKYRKNDNFGSGLEYITHKKYKQMKFAAEIWLASSEWNGDSCLAVVEADYNLTEVDLVELV